VIKDEPDGDVNNDCEDDWQMEALVHDWVADLRQLNCHWHDTPAGFIRYANEREPDGPHLLCHHADTPPRMRFDLVLGRGVTVYSGLSFRRALAAYFHVVFATDLEYAREGEAVAIWLQRKVAGIKKEGKSLSYLYGTGIHFLFVFLLAP
jgi:hypothetical protein